MRYRLSWGWMGVLCVGAISVMGLACGGAPPMPSPLRPEHRTLFFNGIDGLERPEDLAEPWSERWQAELEERIDASHFIAVVTLDTLRADVSLEQRTTYRLLVGIERVVHQEWGAWGTLRAGDELTLASQANDSGHASVESRGQASLSKRFLAYVRWYLADDGGMQARWQLIPESARLLRETHDVVRGHRRSTKKD